MQTALVHVIARVFSGAADALFGMSGDNHSRTTLDDLRDGDGVLHVPPR
jgi:hypothetical protein